MDKAQNTARSVGLEDYSGSITIRGRNLITSLLAGETITFTRIVVGSGRMPDDVDIWDMTDLVSPVAEATSTFPTVEDGVMSMIVEYRNDMNGGLTKGFWLQEFGIYAKTDKSDEVLLYYAAMGDSPQPVNPYKDNRIDIRRYPVFIELFIDANVQVSYNPGAFVTAAEAEELIRIMVRDAVRNAGTTVINSITIPCEGWQKVDDDGEYRHQLDLSIDGVTWEQVPHVTIHKDHLKTAKEAGLCPSVQSFNGYIRFWTMETPQSNMEANLTLLIKGPDNGENKQLLPVASRNALGGVKVGDGLNITSDGTLSLDAATGEDLVAALNGSNAGNGEE